MASFHPLAYRVKYAYSTKRAVRFMFKIYYDFGDYGWTGFEKNLETALKSAKKQIKAGAKEVLIKKEACSSKQASD